jgi:hypothetical protein
VPLILPPKWNPELVLDIIERHDVSRIAFGRTMYWVLLRSPMANDGNIGRMRFVASGTAPIASSLSDELLQAHAADGAQQHLRQHQKSWATGFPSEAPN